MRHATYLINRVATRSLEGKTPYEALRTRKPNLSHLKVFGCVCYGRTEAAGRKKFDDRSRVLVHLGTEPGSKAYRLLDPSTKRVVVSRDVIFEEEKEWNWNHTTQAISNDSEEFTVYVNRLSNGSGDTTSEVDDTANDPAFVEDEDDETDDEEEEESSHPQTRDHLVSPQSHRTLMITFSSQKLKEKKPKCISSRKLSTAYVKHRGHGASSLTRSCVD